MTVFVVFESLSDGKRSAVEIFQSENDALLFARDMERIRSVNYYVRECPVQAGPYKSLFPK